MLKARSDALDRRESAMVATLEKHDVVREWVVIQDCEVLRRELDVESHHLEVQAMREFPESRDQKSGILSCHGPPAPWIKVASQPRVAFSLRRSSKVAASLGSKS